MRYFFLLLFIGVSSISISQNFTKERDKFVKECQRAFVEPDQVQFVREKLSKMIHLHVTLKAELYFDKEYPSQIVEKVHFSRLSM